MLQLRNGVQRVTTAGSALLFDTRSGDYFTLNPTAATVLDALAETGDPDSAAARLAAMYGIDTARAASDVTALTTRMTELRLVEHR
ncbi:lasso peptide biosynthesis PqqD family chaperone [Streptomyces graminilatus]|uniref:lasso peptide biosynthesis PqqD family chaperone n=1 Tax=Streptomyces graminilatus TaxID=1464070 RepID=UPI0006E3ECDF|nr:lasso peptide biosynthesis PqqD family chaperone [Streptomyces graminilatus]